VDFGRSNLEQILFSLELKDLVTARSVCRLWAGLIDCKFFRDRFVERWRVGYAISRRYLAVISSSLAIEIWNLDEGCTVTKLDLNQQYYVKRGGEVPRMSFNDSALLVFGLRSSVDGKPMIFALSGQHFALVTYVTLETSLPHVGWIWCGAPYKYELIRSLGMQEGGWGTQLLPIILD
jgi:hypothetical protein